MPCAHRCNIPRDAGKAVLCAATLGRAPVTAMLTHFHIGRIPEPAKLAFLVLFSSLDLGTERSIIARFWSKVIVSAECWEWGASLFSNGYGQFSPIRTRKIHAHRFAWEAFYGSIPDGLYVCHRCDNRRCVRPSHLFLGTARDNSRDALAKGRLKSPGIRGRSHYKARLTDVQVVAARSVIAAHGGTYSTIAAELGIDRKTIRDAVLGVTWKHLP
jgi:hypothetical protein